MKGTSEEGTGRGMDGGRDEASGGGIERGREVAREQERAISREVSCGGTDQHTVYSQTIPQRGPCH